MEKILITGGSHSEIPLIDAAHKLGYFVISTGNNQEGLGHKKADKYVPGDFADKEFVYSLAKKEKVAGIISGCNDFAYLSTAYACEKIGLMGHDSYKTSSIIHHKDTFIECLKKNNIPAPGIEKCKTELDVIKACKQFDYPVIVKPVDLTGGKGVSVCHSHEEAIVAFHEAMEWTREQYVAVEEYITGTNHGASILLKGKKAVAVFIDEEQYFLNKYLVAGACTINPEKRKSVDALVADIEKLAEALDLEDGLFHTQFILNNNDYPVMIDPCRRTPGDLYVLLAKMSTGNDYAMEIVKSELGLDMGNEFVQQNNFIARECIMANKTGKIKDIVFSAKILPYIRKEMIWAQEGDVIEEVLKYKAGILFLGFETYQEMKQIVDNFNELVKIEFV